MVKAQSAALRDGRSELAKPVNTRPAPLVRTNHLDGAQKAAIIVRWLISEGLDLPLIELPEAMQARLTHAIGSMRLIDRQTMAAVIEEFAETLDQVGLSFPQGLEGALSLIGAQLGDQATGRLRDLALRDQPGDPWAQLESMPDDILRKTLAAERLAVGAVILSKLSITKSARLLEELPSDLAQNLALNVASIDTISPDAVARIGASLAQQLKSRPVSAFKFPPAQRMGEILNSTPGPLRMALLEGIEAQDANIAREVRKAIISFEDLPLRLASGDVPAFIRAAGSDPFVTIRAATMADPNSPDAKAMDYLIENMSKRLAEGLREDAEILKPPNRREFEDAIRKAMGTLREMLDEGALSLHVPEEES